MPTPNSPDTLTDSPVVRASLPTVQGAKIIARPALQIYTRVLYREGTQWVDEAGNRFDDQSIRTWTPASDLPWMQR